ncbi:Hint domain-containing protein [Ovoidimarina sediminis]|uniref:Hint domain-containing protein n=1 Tax=Ovoidimarina sediminis TaxID=3079856 RepID=UPI002913709E|nr:Hint domain-containing protein [Rhodophyticola sp. MJ-SS7]MDU8943327.1 Hint domain-containing protein [Rhodophyticola sp. MJ-SS7]
MNGLQDVRHGGRRVASGLVGGTRIETEIGWQRVEDVIPGTQIHTFDGGLRTLKSVIRARYGADLPKVYPEGLTLIPGGALGNCEALYVLPDQGILLAGAAVESVTGQHRVLVRGADIAGHGEIGLAMPVDGIEVVSLRFEDEEVVYANTGLCLHCPADGRAAVQSQAFPVLDAPAADLLMSCRFLEGHRASTRQRPRRVAAAV